MYAPKTIFTWAMLFLLVLCAVVLAYSRMIERIPEVSGEEPTSA